MLFGGLFISAHEASKFFLSEGAICIGDGDHVAVRFGENATVAITDILTVLGERVHLEKPDFVVGHCSIFAVIMIFNMVTSSQTHPNFTISAPSEVMTCMEKVTVEVKQITGDGRRNLRYQWRVKNGA